ncbi:hypothetical protein M8J77_013639 [Diaphorina citri]|nr:hypothetical protein M8J77_013639 [Diaphorina citri]
MPPFTVHSHLQSFYTGNAATGRYSIKVASHPHEAECTPKSTKNIALVLNSKHRAEKTLSTEPKKLRLYRELNPGPLAKRSTLLNLTTFTCLGGVVVKTLAW